MDSLADGIRDVLGRTRARDRHRPRWSDALSTGRVSALLVTGLVGVAGCGGSSSSTSTGASGAPHKGGTMILLENSNWGTNDPAANYTVAAWQPMPITNDGLVTFGHAGGAAGTKIVPDLATSVPAPTSGGKTYTFTLRKGIRYSNGEPLRASDFLTVIKRQFTVPGPANNFYEGIVGAPQCAKTPQKCDLSKGVIANDRTGTVTFNLTAPDPEFLDKLAVPFAYAVPAGTSPHNLGNNAPPGTGPYMWKYYRPNCCGLLVRNPHFHVFNPQVQPAGYPNQILYKFGLPVESEVTEVENGQADWMFDQPPADRLSQLSTTYASQTHVNPVAAFYYMALNVNIPPFTNLKARQALNYGIDRTAYVKIFGGPELAVPTCQVLPPGFPGYKQYCPYTANPAPGGFGRWTAPDMAKARQLVAESGEKGAKVAVVGTGSVQYPYVQNSTNHVQVAYSDWYLDYPAASDFLDVLFGCSYFHPGSDASPNESGFCNKPIQGEMTHAYKVAETNQVAANQIWAGIDQGVTNQAPMVSLFNPRFVNVVSKRIAGFEYNPIWSFLVDQAWIK